MSRLADWTRRRPARARRRLHRHVGVALAIILITGAAACRHDDEDRTAPARIVFLAARDGEYALYAIGGDGRGLTRVATASPSLGSQQVGLVPSPQYEKLIVPGVDDKLRVLDADGVHELAPYAAAAAWSPDGKRIAFAGLGPGLWIVGAEGDNRRRLTRNEGDDGPAWSPDGERIAFTRSGVGLLVIDADGGDRRVVWRSRRVLERVEWASTEAISFREERELAAGDLLTVAVPSGRLVRRVRNSGWGFYDPVIRSPDGRRVAFTTGNERASVIVMNVDGSGRHRVTPPDEYASQPAWSPDGRLLAYIRHDELGRRELWGVRPDGSGRRALTRAYPNGPDPLLVAWMHGSLPMSQSRYRVREAKRAEATVLQTTYPVAAMTARGSRVALVSPPRAYTQLHYWLTPPLLVWNATRGTTTRLSLGICGQPESVALSRDLIAYDCPFDSHAGRAGALAISSNAASPPFIAAAGYVGDGQEKPAALPGRVAAGDNLLVFNDRLYRPFGRLSARRLWRTDGDRKILVTRGRDAAAPAAVGEGLIVVERDDGRLAVLTDDGRVVARIAAGRRPTHNPLLRLPPPSAVLTDGSVVVLRRGRLSVHPLAGAAKWTSPLRSWSVGRDARLAGAARGLIAYIVGTDIHVLRLNDGRRATIPTRSRARLPAALTTNGLFYAMHSRPVPAREQPPFHANPARVIFLRHEALLRRLN